MVPLLLKSKSPIRFLLRGMFLLLFLPARWYSPATLQQQEINPPALLILGSTDSSVFPGFVEAAIKHNQQNLVDILVLPAGLSPDPIEIDSTQRQQLIIEAEKQSQKIAAICSQKISADLRCRVNYAPILVRSDAQSAQFEPYFNQTLSAILILERAPYNTNRILNGTAVERQLSQAYNAGVLVAGGKYLSRSSITGYATGYSLETALNLGALETEVLPGAPVNSFQLDGIFVVPDFSRAGSVGQALNALSLAEFPKVGIGIVRSSGLRLTSGRRLEQPFGQDLITVFDAQTYQVSPSAFTAGSTGSLNLRNVLLHTLAVGESSYDLLLRQHSLNPPVERLPRDFSSLTLPRQAGLLYLSGKLEGKVSSNPLLVNFLNQAGGKNAKLAVIVAGYPTQESASLAAQAFDELVEIPIDVQYQLRPSAPPVIIPSEVSGIVILARYPSLLAGIQLGAVENAWRLGLPLMAVDAAASLVGSNMVTQALPAAGEPKTANRVGNFGTIPIEPGLNLVKVNFEPQVNEENRWGRWLQLAYYHPDQLTLGLASNSAIVITPNGAFSIGQHPLVILDLSAATLGLGEAAQLVIANGLIDVFAPGEILIPQIADKNAAPIQILTSPERAQITSSPSETPGIEPTAQATPEPTETEIPSIIPISDLPVQPGVLLRPPPGQVLTFLLIALPVLMVAIILLGLWVNRRSLK